MIELLEGVPGSGKSYYAVAERFLSWARANRKIYIYVDGIFLDRLGAFEGRSVDELQKQIIVWQTPDDVRAGLLDVEPGSAVILDEAQTIFRSREKVDPELLRMLETHRHKGIDLVMMCQQHGQMTLGVLRLVEVTTKFRRLDRFGLKGRYQAQVRGNPEETDVIRMFTGTYSPGVYAYYSSYSNAAVRESARGGSILKSPTVILGALGLVVAVGWFAFGGWLSGAKPPQAASLSKLPPPPLPAATRSQPVVVPSPVRPIRIQGGMTTIRGKEPVWLWVSDEGQLMTEDEIAAESGGTVSSRMVRGVRVLSGSGVIWGGADAKQGAAVSGAFPVPAWTKPDTDERAPGGEVSSVPPGSPGTEVLATPPGLLATPPGLLATPPGL
ncbi:MAG: zonular occludens toxin domain-containing protein [Nitrospirota bacterium]|nr:zonular occludens toxin domain-containing protein [Nitrospirota bacterium]